MKKAVSALVIMIGVFILLGNFRTYMVMGASDIPTFFTGDKVIVNRSAYDVTIPFTSLRLFPYRNPQRGDMVLCRFTRTGASDYWLKRIIGLPGDTIEIKKNRIYINHQPLRYEVLKKETFNLKDGMGNPEIIALEKGHDFNHTVTLSEIKNIISDFGPLVVTENHFFVLGDNRTNSLDSRFLGLVNRYEIYGKYLFRIYRSEQ